MNLLAAPAVRAFTLCWLLLGSLHALGRAGLMAAATIDLRLPSFFDLAVLPPLQAIVLLWLLRRWRADELTETVRATLRQASARRALVAATVAAGAAVVARAVGLAGRAVQHDARLAFALLLLLATGLATFETVRRGPRGRRIDWALAALFGTVVGSNLLSGWLTGLAVRALPEGVGAPAATGELAVLAVVVATALALRLERWLTPAARMLLWAALGLHLVSATFRLFVFLYGYPVEPWTTAAVVTRLLTGGLALGSLLFRRLDALPPASDGESRPHDEAPDLAWWRLWVGLALVHIALSATMSLVLFDGWQVDAPRVASWFGITAVQATAVLAARRWTIGRSRGPQ